jgi:hypothetical protein
MIKYYIANSDKTKFAYITNGWQGGTKLIYNDKKPHFFSLDRAKRVMAQCRKYNIISYNIFEIEITLPL